MFLFIAGVFILLAKVVQIKLHPNSGISLKVTAQGSARLGCYQSIKCVTTGNCGGNESCAGSSREARKQLTISVFDCGLEGPRWYTGSGGMTNGSNTDEGTEATWCRERPAAAASDFGRKQAEIKPPRMNWKSG